MEKLDFLIKYLLSERNDVDGIGIPESEQDKFRFYRSLVNIRPAVKDRQRKVNPRKRKKNVNENRFIV